MQPSLAPVLHQSTLWDELPDLAAVSRNKIIDSDGRPRTLYLRIETVNLCNNDCIVCAYSKHERKKTHMPMGMFEKAVTDYIDIGGGYVSLTPLVGDVFLDKFLLDRIRLLTRTNGITGVGFTTNAAMAHRFTDKELAEIISPLKRLSISIYGLDREEYGTMTQRNTFDAMVRGIKRIISVAKVPISLEFRLLKARPLETIEFWAEKGMGIKLGTEAKINSVLINYGNWGIFDDANAPLPHDANWYSFQSQTQRPQCLIPLFSALIFSNGNVSFCNCDNFQDTEELRLGNITEMSLGEIYSSEKVRALWNWAEHGVPKFCQGCSLHMPLAWIKSNPSIVDDPHQIVGAG